MNPPNEHLHPMTHPARGCLLMASATAWLGVVGFLSGSPVLRLGGLESACLGGLSLALLLAEVPTVGPRVQQALLAALGVLLVAGTAAHVLRGPGAPAAAWGLTGPVAAAGLALAAAEGAARHRPHLAATLGLVPLLLGGFGIYHHLAGLPHPLGVGPGWGLEPGAALLLWLLGAGLILRLGLRAWPLALFGRPAKRSEGQELALSAFLGYLGITAILGVAGTRRLRVEVDREWRAQSAELQAIGTLKALDLAGWHRDRRADATLLTAGNLLTRHFEPVLKDPAALEGHFRAWLEALRGHAGYEALVLHDAAGRRVLALPPGIPPAAPPPGGAAPLALRDAGGGIRLSQWVPIRRDRDGALMGTLELRTDPAQAVQPILDAWAASQRMRIHLFQGHPGHGFQLGSGEAPSRLEACQSGALGGCLAEAPAGLTRLNAPGGGQNLTYQLAVTGTPWMLAATASVDGFLAPYHAKSIREFGVLAALCAGAAFAIRAWLAWQAEAETSARLEARVERRALQDRLDLFLDLGSDIVFLLDAQGRIQEANARAEAAYGRSSDSLRGLPFGALRGAMEAAAFPAILERVRRRQMVRVETHHQHRDGTLFPVEETLRPVTLAGIPWVAVLVRDLTQTRERARLMRSLNRIHATRARIHQAIADARDLPDLLRKTPRILAETGRFPWAWVSLEAEAGEAPLSAQAGKGGPPPDLGVLDEGPQGRSLRDGHALVLRAGRDAAPPRPWAPGWDGLSAVAVFPLVRGEGVRGLLVVHAAEAASLTGAGVGLLREVSRDLSSAIRQLDRDAARRRAEADLRELNGILDQAQAVGNLGAYGLDVENGAWVCTPNLDRILGIGPGHPKTVEGWISMVAPDQRDAMRAYLVRILEDRSRFDREYAIVRPATGETRWVHGWGEFQLDPMGRVQRMVGVIQDITERKASEKARLELEAHLAQVQRLESLGILAGGVAHDMNNVLAAILAIASLQEGAAEPGSALARRMGTIVKACDRGREVVKSILFFARQGLARTEGTDLNEVVQEVCQLLSSTTFKRIQVRLELEPDLAPVLADGVAISHALMNLCVNAVDAMPAGGALLLRTGAGPDGSVDLEVADSGEGMPPEVLKRAMEPFFTTKPQGKGTGLGLAMVYGTMQAHDGELVLTSRPGEGTRALLRFPASRVLPVKGPGPEELPDEGADPRRRVLLVEDDPLVRAAQRDALEALGHEVRTAENGLEALVQLESGLRPDVVVLDMNMPVLNGPQTLPRIRQLCPGQPVIVVSGHMDAQVSALLEGDPTLCFLPKPFTPAELRTALRTAVRPNPPTPEP
ncbi:ATP-binding protein [Mesoterricola sediminis]|uniref:histidine kinase n=1 Tax=Mesoterricola sediminis TaxID=2927980 RepID=A0AA48KH24_9BACT|nr:ATP-binding protein [Mesoterricola sediminis]BDU77963.1 hypothetical protein METESE_29210 [Mesoterricola sediminis]